mgnify:CR=1 FL=1
MYAAFEKYILSEYSLLWLALSTYKRSNIPFGDGQRFLRMSYTLLSI